MNEPLSARPDNGSDFSLRSMYAYFTLWITQKDSLDQERFRAQDEKTSLALANAEKAISKAEAATEKRFDAVNEFRGTLSDQATTLLPRAEAATKFSSYDEKIDDLKKEVQELREYRSEVAATKIQAHDDQLQSNWTVERVVAVLAVAAVLAEAILSRKP